MTDICIYRLINREKGKQVVEYIRQVDTQKYKQIDIIIHKETIDDEFVSQNNSKGQINK